MPLESAPVNVAFSKSLVPKTGPYSTETSVSVVTVICLDHDEQRGQYFGAFSSKMTEEYRYGRCSRLVIVESGSLKRYYLPFQDPDYSPETPINSEAIEAEACNLGNNWIEQHQSYIEQMSEAGLTVELWSWKKMRDMEMPNCNLPFKDCLEMVQRDLALDNARGLRHCFDTLVEANAEKAFQASLSRKTQAKKQELCQREEIALKNACLQAARNYLIEECASILKLDRCGFAKLLHPMKQNPAMTWIFSLHKEEMLGLEWMQYTICPQKGAKKLHKGKRPRGCFFSVSDNSVTQQTEQQADHRNVKEHITELMDQLTIEARGLLLRDLFEHYRTPSLTGPSQTL